MAKFQFQNFLGAAMLNRVSLLFWYNKILCNDTMATESRRSWSN